MSLDLSCCQIGTLASSELVLEQLANSQLDYASVSRLNVSHCNLETLDGIELFENLEHLDASFNSLHSFSALWLLPKLDVVILNNNNISKLNFVRNGALTWISTGDEFVKSKMVQKSFKFLDLSFNNIDSIVLSSSSCIASLMVDTLLLSHNRINDFSGLCGFMNMSVVDLENNKLCNAQHLNQCQYNESGCKIFLNDTKLENEEALHLLLKNTSLLVHLNDQVNQTNRNLINIRALDFTKLRPKLFVNLESTNEFAGFVYQGDDAPSELMTRRLSECDQKSEDVLLSRNRILDEAANPDQLVKRTTCNSKYMNTLSTMADFGDIHIDGKIMKSCTTSIEHSGNDESPCSVCSDGSLVMEQQLHTNAKTKQIDHVDFLVSSAKLCNKLDEWTQNVTEEIKNTIQSN